LRYSLFTSVLQLSKATVCHHTIQLQLQLALLDRVYRASIDVAVSV